MGCATAPLPFNISGNKRICDWCVVTCNPVLIRLWIYWEILWDVLAVLVTFRSSFTLGGRACAGFYTPGWWKIRDPDNPHDCTVEELEQAIQGYFTADALPRSLSTTPGISGKVLQRHCYKRIIIGSDRRPETKQRIEGNMLGSDREGLWIGLVIGLGIIDRSLIWTRSPIWSYQFWRLQC